MQGDLGGEVIDVESDVDEEATQGGAVGTDRELGQRIGIKRRGASEQLPCAKLAKASAVRRASRAMQRKLEGEQRAEQLQTALLAVPRRPLESVAQDRLAALRARVKARESAAPSALGGA